MLRSARKTQSLALAAKDGRIGHVREFYFDDHRWAIRYLVAQAGYRLTGSMVLLSPHSLGLPDDARMIIPVDLTREQIRQSPSPETGGDPHLRSTDEITGYRVHARDGVIGHVEDFLYDDKDWSIRFMAMDTRNLWGGKRVLVPPAWIAGFRWEDRLLEVDADRDDLRNAPAYDPNQPVSDEFAKQLSRYFEIYSLERSPG